MLLLFLACQPEEVKEPPNTAVALNIEELRIYPENPTPNDIVICEASVNSEQVQVDYSWFSNSSGVYLQTNQLRPSQTAWGESWTCIATPFIEEQLGSPHSESIEFINDCSIQIEYEGDITLSPTSPPLNFCNYY